MNPTELAAARSDTDAFAERVLQSTLGLIDMLSIHLGDRLGWYRALAVAGEQGLDAAGLAEATGTHERYAREWLEQQAVSGILTLTADGAARRFVLPAAAREVLTDPRSLSFMAPVARMFAASMVQLPALVEAYRTGGGVSWERLGEDARESQADVNRPWFERMLAPALAGSAELHGLLSRPGARIADIGCGLGWSTLALARAYPAASLLGIDIDAPSIARAGELAAEEQLAGRVEFRAADAATLGTPEELDAAGLGAEGEFDAAGLQAAGEFDAAFVFEALHDMPHPVEVLRAIRSALTDGGVLVVADEAVADEFAPDGDEVERLMYGYSLLVCLPDSLSADASVGTGTVMRRATLERYAHDAGFRSVEVLPIEDFALFRFYLLRP
jgi:SAM-dependent methyltransferase